MLYRRISADCHIDLPWLPPDLFVSEASPSLRHLMPRVVDGEDGSRWVTGDGRHLGLVNGVGPRGNPHIPGRNARVDRMAATGLYEDAKNGIRRCTEPDLRIKDLSDDGIDAEVIYGILGAAARIDNHTAVNEMVRIYNDWLNEFCSRHPERHIGLASLPYQDVDAAVAEVYRVAKCGFRGVELACAWDMAPLCDPSWEPLWQALNEMDLPLHFHTAFRTPWDYPERFTGQTRRAVLFMLEAGFQMATVNILGAMMGAALFERYPRIRVVFGESGIGWLPYVLHRLDFEWEHAFRDIGLRMRPSEYWKRQCRATFQFDPIGLKLLDDLCEDTVMWGADYPHADGVWPGSADYIAEQFGHLPPTIVHKITCENAGRFYGLMT